MHGIVQALCQGPVFDFRAAVFEATCGKQHPERKDNKTLEKVLAGFLFCDLSWWLLLLLGFSILDAE